jgi:hypothetical protein
MSKHRDCVGINLWHVICTVFVECRLCVCCMIFAYRAHKTTIHIYKQVTTEDYFMCL